MTDFHLSRSAALILQTIADGYGYGFDIMDATGLPSGTVYPALRRMEAAGLILSQWEDAVVAQREQRPLRKYYALTKLGRHTLADVAARYRLTDPAPARRPRPFPAKS